MKKKKPSLITPEKPISTGVLKKYADLLPYALLAAMIVFFLSAQTPNVDYDASTYIHFDAIRPPIYPAFIWLFHWMGRFQFEGVVWTQSILTFSSFIYARYWLKKYLQLSDVLIFMVILFVLITISFHFQMNFVESEGLSFPLFIITFFTLVECFQKFDIKKIVLLSLLVGVLILMRLQFYFFYPVFAMLLFWHFLKDTPRKPLFVAFVILFGSVLLTQLIDRSYHYFKHGSFGTASYYGLGTIIQPLYLAGKDTPNYFQDKQEKATFQNIISQFDQRELRRFAALLTSFKLKHYEYANEEYSKNYTAMQTIVANAIKPFSFLEGNKITGDITKTLVLQQPTKNLLFYGWKVIDAFGGVPVFLFYCLILFAVLFRIRKNNTDEVGFAYSFVATVILLTFSNTLLVALVEPALTGYFCYSQFMLYCLAALFSDRVFFNEKFWLQKQ